MNLVDRNISLVIQGKKKRKRLQLQDASISYMNAKKRLDKIVNN